MPKKKNENTLQYLQMPLPEGRRYSKMTKVSFGGLNKRYTIDSGDLSMERNISTNEYPYLTPSNSVRQILSGYAEPISMTAFDDFLIVVYGEEKLENSEFVNRIKVDYITKRGKVHTGILENDSKKALDSLYTQRSIVQFNVYDTPTDPLTGQYVKKLLFFPDKCSMYMKIVDTDTDPEIWDDEDLKEKDLSVMYCYEVNDKKYYYTVILVENTEGGDEDRKTYKRIIQQKYNSKNPNCFICDGMEVLVKSYSNTKSETDKSGATIYPPPETADHNYYYLNTANIEGTNFGTDVYRWCEYETEDGGIAEGWKVSVPPSVPNLKHVTVHLSRVFGVDDDRVYASGFNDYTNWNLDTIGEYNESNSWCSPSQSNTKAGGSFTGITTYDGHVICFKRDFMHEIYNTKNPFRLQDIYAEGCIDSRTIQDVDGKLIFVSEDDVKIYTGSNPRIIGYNLNMSQFKYAVSGTDNRNYYLYCEDSNYNTYLYVYDTVTELWSEQSVPDKVLSFAHNQNGMYMLCDNGCVYKMDTGSYNHSWSFETDLITNKTVDIKHIKKLQMLVDLAENANMKVYVIYDDEDFNENTSHLVYSSNKSGRVPIRVKPRKTANYGFRLHVEGSGYAKIYELEIFVEAGGDMYV